MIMRCGNPPAAQLTQLVDVNLGKLSVIFPLPIGDLWYFFITQLLNIFQLSELFFPHLLREFLSGLEDVGGGDANTQLEGRRDCHRGTRGEQRGEGRWFQQVVLGILGLGVNQD